MIETQQLDAEFCQALEVKSRNSFADINSKNLDSKSIKIQDKQ